MTPSDQSPIEQPLAPQARTDALHTGQFRTDALHTGQFRTEELRTDPFPYGVGSGDPTSRSMVLWTRLAPDAPRRDATVRYEVATDAEFSAIVASGVSPMEGEAADIARPEVTSLQPGTTYWYRFRRGDAVSPVGRTATLAEDGDSFRVGIVCCARWPSGDFAAYRRVSEQEPDLVVHLGDYIYEDGADGPRGSHDPPHECRTAADYNRRYAQYRIDPDLLRLHAVAPWVTVWDDHELSNDAWRSGTRRRFPRRSGDRSDRGDEGISDARRLDATRTYHDWMAQARHGNGPTPLDRVVRLGGIADLVIVDTRLAGRDRPAGGGGGPVLRPHGPRAGDRRLLADEQWAWLEEVVGSSQAPWVLLCTQVQLSPLHLAFLPARAWPPRVEPLINPDQWDGYPAERDRLVDLLESTGRRNVLVLSGDLHGRFVTALRTETMTIAEVTTPSVSAPTFAHLVARRVPVPARVLARWLRLINPSLQAADLHHHGATIIEVTEAEVRIIAITGPGEASSTWRLGRDGAALERIDHGAQPGRRCKPGSIRIIGAARRGLGRGTMRRCSGSLENPC